MICYASLFLLLRYEMYQINCVHAAAMLLCFFSCHYVIAALTQRFAAMIRCRRLFAVILLLLRIMRVA